MREVPVRVSMAHTAPFEESAARMVVALRVVRPLRNVALGSVAVRVMMGMSLLGGNVRV